MLPVCATVAVADPGPPPLETRLALDLTELYTTSSDPFAPQKTVRDTNLILVNNDGDTLIKAEFNGSSAGDRPDVWFYSAFEQVGPRANPIWIQGQQTSLVDNAPGVNLGNSLPLFLLDDGRVFYNETSFDASVSPNRGSRMVRGTGVDTASPSWSFVQILGPDGNNPPAPSVSATETLAFDGTLRGLKHVNQAQTMWFDGVGQNAANQTVGAIYRKADPAAAPVRLVGHADQIALNATDTYVPFRPALTAVADSGDFLFTDSVAPNSVANRSYYSYSTGGDLALVYARNQAVPDRAGASFATDALVEADVSSTGGIAFQAALNSGGGIFTAQAGIANSLQTVAITGDTVNDGSGRFFSSLNSNPGHSPKFTADGDVVFIGRTDRSGLWNYDTTSGLFDELLSDGDEIGTNSMGTWLIDGMQEFAVNALGQIAIRVSTVTDDDNFDGVALLVIDPIFGIVTVAQTGDVVNVDGSDVTVTNVFTSLNKGIAGAGPTQLSSAFANSGWLGYEIRYDGFSGETGAVFVTRVIPEPTTGLLLAGAGITLVSWRRRKRSNF